jgi:DNA-binding XRE family transcriptional regulator
MTGDRKALGVPADTRSQKASPLPPEQAALAKVIRDRRLSLPSVSGKKKKPGHLSQEELAGEAGLTVSSIKRLERGIANPTWESVFAVAGALNLSMTALGALVDEALGRDPDQTFKPK